MLKPLLLKNPPPFHLQKLLGPLLFLWFFRSHEAMDAFKSPPPFHLQKLLGPLQKLFRSQTKSHGRLRRRPLGAGHRSLHSSHHLEIDMEAADHNVNAYIFRARTLLIREALIVLNRLVSSPAYAAIVLQVLTSSRDMASLTIDVANRLSRKDQRKGKSESITRQMRQLEVVDLGRVFRRRVFTYLRDST